MEIESRKKTENTLTIIFGALKAIMAIVLIILAIIGGKFGIRFIQDIGLSMDQTLENVDQNIDIVSTLLTETIDIFDMIDQSLSTVEKNTIDAAIAMNGSIPIIEKSSCYNVFE